MEQDLRIDEAENAFALCDFERSLSLATEILNDCALERSQDQLNIMKNSSVIQLRVPRLVLLEENSTETNDCTFVVNVIMNLQGIPSSLCLRERAGAILIQASYELWKRRNGDKLDEKLCLDLCLIEKSYSASRNSGVEDASFDSLDFSKCPVLMTLELVLLYIEFCHSVGLHKSSLITCLDILVVLNCLESDSFLSEIIHEDDERNCLLDSCYNYSYAFLSIILLRTIPYIKEVRLAESIVDAIFSLCIKQRHGEKCDFLNNAGDEMNPMWDNLYLSSNMHQSSINVMCRNVEAILISGEESLPIYFLEALHDSLLDAKQLLRIHPNDVDNTINNMERKQESSPRLIDFAMESLDNEHEQKGTFNFIHRIAEPLWDSDDRWINRGKIVLACIVSYSVWRQRNRVWMGTKSIWKRKSSPIHGIVKAIVMPKK